jgi:hypothetical protein
MKKSENDLLIEEIKDLMKMMNRDQRLDQNEVCASLFFDESLLYDHR